MEYLTKGFLPISKQDMAERNIEQLDFIYDRCFNKMMHLEDAGLKDTPCYRLSLEITHLIYEVKKEKEENN